MKTSSGADEQTLFGQRLISALQQAELSCAPTEVAHGFNLRGGGARVTSHAARKWLLGQAIPTQSNIHVLADWVGVNAAWLRFGEGERHRPLSLLLEDCATDASMVSMFNDLRSLPMRDQLLLRELIDVLMEAQALQQDGNI
ncbi:hypothetical protein [Massilia sp. CCM 8734]|uniref:hypothetical protein n=1 Tax=Massilia sp. CCM 8734 TaxID=2609283 RepID=UPI00141FC1AC|nr:hypothetical protein [Massilia sp. CCM 8734]NIA00565.1 hypothetical protein [Massilia sp. CCM 8734]